VARIGDAVPDGREASAPTIFSRNQMHRTICMTCWSGPPSMPTATLQVAETNGFFEGLPVADQIIGQRTFTDGSTRPVYRDDTGQYVLDDHGQPIPGVWLVPDDRDPNEGESAS
jgi:hypothetical protein